MNNDITSPYKVIGIMSGTSLDGLDIAYCEFEINQSVWSYKIVEAITVPYDNNWLVRLTNLDSQPAYIYPKTDLFYGKYIGQQINKFIRSRQLKPSLIASHGHTVYHQPHNGFTAQIGHGGAIYAETGIPTISDFRTVDVMLGGQGAPLVPIGDELLFSNFDACLNLGGIANISYRQNGKRLAYDISPCNILLNGLAQELKLTYDDAGNIARSGEVIPDLLNSLNEISYYQQSAPKSLGNEFIEEQIWPIIRMHEASSKDKLATVVEHIALQISSTIMSNSLSTLLITGGGAYNTFLIDQINKHASIKCTIPSDLIIQYKEALIFAFLGVLKLRGEINVLNEVTGARKSNIGGAYFG